MWASTLECVAHFKALHSPPNNWNSLVESACQDHKALYLKLRDFPILMQQRDQKWLIHSKIKKDRLNLAVHHLTDDIMSFFYWWIAILNFHHERCWWASHWNRIVRIETVKHSSNLFRARAYKQAGVRSFLHWCKSIDLVEDRLVG